MRALLLALALLAGLAGVAAPGSACHPMPGIREQVGPVSVFLGQDCDHSLLSCVEWPGVLRLCNV